MRKLLFLILLIASCGSAYAFIQGSTFNGSTLQGWGAGSGFITQIIFSGLNDDLSATATEYMSLQGAEPGSWQNNASRNRGTASTGGTLKNLRVALAAAPGSGKSYAFAVMKDGVVTSLTCTISDTATSCNDTTNDVTVTANQQYGFRAAPTSTPAVTDVVWTVEFDPTTDNESLALSHAPPTFIGTSYVVPSAVAGSPSATELNRQLMVPTSGTYKKLYMQIKDPGVGNTWTVTARKNAADTTLTCTISSGSTACSDTSNSFTVAAGDRVSIKLTSSYGSDSIEPIGGMTFLADTAGQHIAGGNSANALSTSVANYGNLQCGGKFWSATDDLQSRSLGQVGDASTMTLKNLYVNGATAPGAGKSYAYTIYKNGSSTALTCTIADTATTCNVTADVSIANDDSFSFQAVPTGTPTVPGTIRWGSVVLSS